jgi:hypothetical protein
MLTKVVVNCRIEIVHCFLKFFIPDVKGPTGPILFLRIHPEDLHFPECVEGIFQRVLQTLSDVPHAAHSRALESLKRLLGEVLRGNRSRADDRKVRERKPGKVTDFGDFKDALGEDRNEPHMCFLTFFVDSSNSFETPRRREDINLFRTVIGEPMMEKKRDG